MIGVIISHYRILAKIGEGGMGEVYVAQDTKLDRQVAIKFLPPSTRANAGVLERFKREAKAAAALNHPNIISVYDIGTHEGKPYIVMEHVEGEPLSALIARKDLPVSRALDLAVEIFEGLSAAHDAGIIHRDIKPDNILVEQNGRVRIVDFGLAKLHGVTAITADDVAVGTAAYMSPEQARGSVVDARSDLFSAGMVLYELVTGRRPFAGENGAAVLYAITNEDHQPLRRFNTHASDGLERVVAKLLAKNPTRRYATAKDAIVDLNTERTNQDRPKAAALRTTQRRLLIGAVIVLFSGVFVTGVWWADQRRTTGDLSVETAPATPRAAYHNSIAVLPFADMSPDNDQEYFSDGVAEELLTLLAKIPELRVTSRSSAFSFKGRNLEIPEIARRLNVAHILEGSVRKSGDQIRITAQLIDAGTDTHLWSETYNRTLDDIFAIQDEIAADVVAQLRGTLLGETLQVRVTDTEAYTLYLQGRHLYGRRTPESMEDAVGRFRGALAIDPDYAPAWAALSNTYFVQSGAALRPFDEGFELARDAADRAHAIDPDFAEAHRMLAWIAMWYDRDFSVAARHMERALALAPGDANVLRYAGGLALILGQVDDGIALREYAVERDPVNPSCHFQLGSAYRGASRWDEAIASMRTGYALQPDGIGYRAFLGEAVLLKAQTEEALELIGEERDECYRLTGLAKVYHDIGRTAASDSVLTLAIEKYERTAAYNIAVAVAYRGETDRVFDWLARAREYEDPGLVGLTWEPFLFGVHSDPRWLPFLESIGKSPEQLAAIEFNVSLPE